MKTKPRYKPRSDKEMRAFFQSLGMHPEVIERAIERRLNNPTGDDLIDVESETAQAKNRKRRSAGNRLRPKNPDLDR